MTTTSSNRSSFPEIAKVVDALRADGATVRVLHITDHDGVTLAGTKPVDDPSLVAVRGEAVADYAAWVKGLKASSRKWD